MEADSTVLAARFALQVGVVLLAAKLGAEVFERWLRQPSVLGELAAGLLIGPFALGGVAWPGIGPLFGTLPPSSFPIPIPLWAFAEMGAVVLLFVVGLETDFSSFVRFGPKSAVVAVGGLVLPFILGDVATVAAGLGAGFLSPGPLFVGAALTATSVGVTARVLGDLGKLDTPEGVTILGAAVIDDVLGILVVAAVISLAQGTGVSPMDIGFLAARAVGAWVVLTGILILAANRIAAVFSGFKSVGAPLALTIGLALVCGFVAHDAGLAMIVGAFSAGLALSRTRLRVELERQVRAVYHVIVPVFFVVVGMLVDVQALVPVLAFGILLSTLAVVGKVVGCGATALGLGFRPIGAVRVGVGMVPRGEVALIVAGIGLASGAVNQEIYSVVVFMTFATTLLAPFLLSQAFRRGGAGFGVQVPAGAGMRAVIELPSGLFEHFERHLLRVFRERGFQTVGELADPEGRRARELRRRAEIVSLRTLPGPDGNHRIEVETEARFPDWENLLASAAASAAAESSAFLDPVTVEAT